jgi:hypothetical protein
MRMRTLVLGAMVVLTAAACGGSGGSSPAPSDCVDLTGHGASITIRMSGLQFHPACFTASASQRLTLENQDGTLHSFTVEGTPIDVDLDPGTTQDLAPVAGTVQPGTY